jgi:tetratricopeptide (TPR) repeat protein
MISPGILVALTNVAWTPLAERYIYFSTALCVIGLGSLVSAKIDQRKLVLSLLALLIVWTVPAVWSTVKRNILWQDKEAFYAQAIKLSPKFNRLRNEYGIALLKSDQKDKALEQFKLGKTGYGTSLALINQVQMLADDGSLDRALSVLADQYPTLQSMNERALRLYAFIRVRMLRDEKYIKDKEAIYEDVQQAYSLIYKKNKEPLYLYRSGQIALSMDDFSTAAQLFQQAYDNAPDGVYYKKAAGKLAKKLKKEAD